MSIPTSYPSTLDEWTAWLTTPPDSKPEHYDDDEIQALRDAVDAIDLGMARLAGYVDYDGNLPPDQNAAMRRLSKLLAALGTVYPDELIHAIECLP